MMPRMAAVQVSPRVSSRARVGVDMKNDGRTHDLNARQWVDCARMAEECGFDSVWMNEDVGHDSFVILALAAQATSRIEVGTAIVNVFHRSAMQMAMGFATLDEVSGGRAVLGLSSGHEPWNNLYHGIPIEAPLARVREYATFIKKAVTGERFEHEGRLFKGVKSRLAFHPAREHLPVYVAGVLPGMIKLAGEVGDGLLTNVVPASYVSGFAAPHLAESATAAGRDPSDLELMAVITCCVSDDPREALDQARETFLWRQNAGPDKMLRTFAPEFHEELTYLHGLLAAGEGAKAQREASPKLVKEVVPHGSGAEVWQGVQRFFDAGCTRVALAPYPRDEKHVKRLMQAVGPFVSKAGDTLT
jgi:alkanesulfonate monooxygenase SsuD/methylene tetrahydromethanopterin reductase-like flavin-dependent oxidoreductase (luciferase family)